ncbi:MAG: potassium-transporting ATPase subunit B, partial [Rhodospirillales bacterium]|nr:potassium-transporting ATPase subunit B [Rhodospirillales bacterium]
MSQADSISLFEAKIIRRASLDALAKLNPITLMRNPVIFVTEIVSALVTATGIEALLKHQPAEFPLVIAAWLWLTVVFATFAEAVAEGRGRARAETLRRARSDTMAKLLTNPPERALYMPKAAPDLRQGDIV